MIYNILELQKMPIAELHEIALSHDVDIINPRQIIMYGILSAHETVSSIQNPKSSIQP
jgi:hypothetical protein